MNTVRAGLPCLTRKNILLRPSANELFLKKNPKNSYFICCRKSMKIHSEPNMLVHTRLLLSWGSCMVGNFSDIAFSIEEHSDQTIPTRSVHMYWGSTSPPSNQKGVVGLCTSIFHCDTSESTALIRNGLPKIAVCLTPSRSWNYYRTQNVNYNVANYVTKIY